MPRKGRKRDLELHPTVKPIALVSDALLDATKRGDAVLYSFCGSGATILAAERTGRRGFGVEIDPLYVDTTFTRWEKTTGGQARHVSGKTFAGLKAERAEMDGKEPARLVYFDLIRLRRIASFAGIAEREAHFQIDPS